MEGSGPVDTVDTVYIISSLVCLVYFIFLTITD
jgi:hypothetical protein